ncbi:MAG TPA: hypothetical protein VH680_06040 [Gemmatimonadales bacterium]|jgi:hypothetical protein
MVAASLLVVLSACSNDAAAPSSLPQSPAEPGPTEAPPTDAPTADAPQPGTPAEAILDNRSSRPGIVFGSFNMKNEYLNTVHTGWMNGGPLDPSNIMTWLSGARAKGGRVVLKLCKGRDSYVKENGRFSLTKWKALVARYRNLPLGSYISDGTIVGHYLIDEPHRGSRWGGDGISPATLEEMARFSKEIWPDLTTMVRVAPSWLASSPITYRYVDAGWTQYTTGKGDAAKWVASEAAAAKQKGLGLVVGMNVMEGGDGSSKIRGDYPGHWRMSPTEIRKYGGALLAQSLACAFFNWHHDAAFYNRADIKSAMTEVSAKARAHAKTACRQ